MPTIPGLFRVKHPRWGDGSVIRIEGTDWIVLPDQFSCTIRVPSESRREFQLLGNSGVANSPVKPTPPAKDDAASPIPPRREPLANMPPTRTPSDKLSTIQSDLEAVKALLRRVDGGDSQLNAIQAKRDEICPIDGHSPAHKVVTWSDMSTWERRRAIESLSNGLPPTPTVARQLAVDFGVTTHVMEAFLRDVHQDGGAVLVVKGEYGQGKTFALRCLEEIALESGFAVTHTEVDAMENRLNRPDQIYRDLIKRIRIPNETEMGARGLARAASRAIAELCPFRDPWQRRGWLARETGCPHLAWLFSDPEIAEKNLLLDLLGNARGLNISRARQAHVLPGAARDWTALSDGSLGDYASFLVSGIGRLLRLIGHRGLLLNLDEMEKWQELNWQAQSRASSFICGLIWAATAEHGRDCHDVADLPHNRRFPGGSPFSTQDRCHLGVAIAMTPRSLEADPVETWSRYGHVGETNLPRITPEKIRDYCRRVSSVFAAAFECPSPSEPDLLAITDHAVGLWRSNMELTNRAAVQSSVAAFHAWRERTHFADEVRHECS